MIYWDAVEKTGVVVRLPTENSVAEFFDELINRYPSIRTPSDYVISVLQNYGCQAAVYVYRREYSGEYNWEYCKYDWYAKTFPYCDCAFFEWPSSVNDFGDIELKAALDLNLLFCEDEAAT